MFEPDEFQQKALATWYKPDNPLHLDPAHPAIKLAGEAGELLDLWGKHQYKPGFDWWECSYCGVSREWLETVRKAHEKPNMKCCKFGPFPLVLDELGDFSYYLRILTYQQQVNFEYLVKLADIPNTAELVDLLANLNLKAAFVLRIFLSNRLIFHSDLLEMIGLLLAILRRLDCPLEKLIELNYQKLNSDPTNHGWKDAR